MALQILLKLDKNGKTIQAELRFIWKYKEHCARSNSCADVEKKNISHDGTWLSGPSVPQQNGTETREVLSNSGWNDCQVPGTKQLKQMSPRRTKKRAASLGHSAARTRKKDRIERKACSQHHLYTVCLNVWGRTHSWWWRIHPCGSKWRNATGRRKPFEQDPV